MILFRYVYVENNLLLSLTMKDKSSSELELNTLFDLLQFICY